MPLGTRQWQAQLVAILHRLTHTVRFIEPRNRLIHMGLFIALPVY